MLFQIRSDGSSLRQKEPQLPTLISMPRLPMPLLQKPQVQRKRVKGIQFRRRTSYKYGHALPVWLCVVRSASWELQIVGVLFGGIRNEGLEIVYKEYFIKQQ